MNKTKELESRVNIISFPNVPNNILPLTSPPEQLHS